MTTVMELLVDQTSVPAGGSFIVLPPAGGPFNFFPPVDEAFVPVRGLLVFGLTSQLTFRRSFYHGYLTLSQLTF